MEKEYVQSSMISSVSYDQENEILYIEFKTNGHLWQYFDVPYYVYEEFKYAESIGIYFNQNIKNRYRGNRC